jgi:cyclopropane-fatty-acyl-phospholipid synthase
MGLWEKGASNLEQSQMHMIDDVIEKLDIKDGDNILFIHIITVRTPNHISSAYTHKYIFPHGRFWNHDAVPSHNKDLKTIERWYMNGTNYSQTFAKLAKEF